MSDWLYCKQLQVLRCTIARIVCNVLYTSCRLEAIEGYGVLTVIYFVLLRAGIWRHHSCCFARAESTSIRVKCASFSTHIILRMQLDFPGRMLRAIVYRRSSSPVTNILIFYMHCTTMLINYMLWWNRWTTACVWVVCSSLSSNQMLMQIKMSVAWWGLVVQSP